MPCYSPLRGWVDRSTGGITFKKPAYAQPEEMKVACGQCLGCRLDRSRTWALRMMHEAQSSEHQYGHSFVTLTYRDKNASTPAERARGKHISDNWSLDKTHVQKFLKRLRKSRPGDRIKYYHCGEYGYTCRHGINLKDGGWCPLCKVGRPHYHMILFNCEFNDKEPHDQKGDQTYYTSPELEELWGYGFVDVGDLTLQSAGYTARYCLKKVTGINAEDHYKQIQPDGTIENLEPEYATMSNGIGKDWYQRFKNDVFPSGEVPVPGGGIDRKVPRYYDEILREEDPGLYELVKGQRKEHALENPEEYAPDRLFDRYRVKRAQIGTLQRD